MAFYVVRNTYRDVPRLAEVRPQHREYLASLHGKLRLGGPLPTEIPPAGLMVFEVADRGELEALLLNDPLVAADLIAAQDVEEWTPSIGEFADRA